MVDNDMNNLPGKITPAMKDPDTESSDGWTKWLPVKSNITDDELKNLEARIGYILPPSYKSFLQYKHFYELLIDEAGFFRHPVDDWRDSLASKMTHDPLQEYLLNKGYIPFADWSDWGLLCFDTNSSEGGVNYPVMLWDHESPDKFVFKAKDFETLLMDLDQAMDSNN